jgi:hypothetical protein
MEETAIKVPMVGKVIEVKKKGWRSGAQERNDRLSGPFLSDVQGELFPSREAAGVLGS